jgi:hypothetical protein
MTTDMLQPALWILLGAIALIKFQFDYILIVAVAVILGVSNIIGFTKCRKGQWRIGGKAD